MVGTHDPSYQVRRALWIAYGVLALGLVFFFIGLYLIRQERPTGLAPRPPAVIAPTPIETPPPSPSPTPATQPGVGEPGSTASPAGEGRLSSTGNPPAVGPGGTCRMNSSQAQPAGQNANAIVIPLPKLPVPTPSVAPLPSLPGS